MVVEEFSEWMLSNEGGATGLRCVQCGEVVDSVILTNRRIQHEETRDDRRFFSVANLNGQTRTYGELGYISGSCHTGACSDGQVSVQRNF